MGPTTRIAFYLYVVMVILDLVFLYFFQDELRWLIKPLLMPLLAIGFLGGIQKPVQNYWLILAALFFSWSGDILLQAKHLFLPGLAAFLIAHVFYILYFLKRCASQKGWVQAHPFYAVPVLIYILLFLYFLFPYLGSLTLPVVIYSFTIGLMLVLAMNCRTVVNPAASVYFIAGALLFVISDSILAINLFAVKNHLSGLIVMITYTLAQWLIVKGALDRKETL